MKSLDYFTEGPAYRWTALAILSIGCFMSMLDTSIVNVALPKMMAVFGVNTDQVEWILTAYMLTMGVIMPTTGYFVDVFGAKRIYLFCVSVFTIGSALCGWAWSNDSMVAFRVIQAIGAGMIVPCSMSMVYRLFAPHERNLAMSFWGISIMVAPSLGPTLSGYLVEYWDWRLIFTINIPIGLIAYLLATFILRETPLSKERRFDYGGFITLTIALFCLLLALNKGLKEGWTSPYIIMLLYISAVSLVLFIIIELRSKSPLWDLSLFGNWNFKLMLIISAIGSTALCCTIVTIPLFLQNFRGYTTMETGIILFPGAVACGLIMPIAGRLADKFGAKTVVTLGLILLGLGTWRLMFLNMNTDYYIIVIDMVIRGIGLGLYLMPLAVLGMSGIAIEKISRASSINNCMRQVSNSMGIAALTTVMQNREIYHTQRIAEKISLNSLIGNAFTDSSIALYRLSGMVKKQAAIFAMNDIYWIVAIFITVGMMGALLLKPPRRNHRA